MIHTYSHTRLVSSYSHQEGNHAQSQFEEAYQNDDFMGSIQVNNNIVVPFS